MKYNCALIILLIALIISIICFIFFLIKLYRINKPKYSKISGGEEPKPEEIMIMYNCDVDTTRYEKVDLTKIKFITEKVVYKYINYIILKLTNVIIDTLEIGKDQAEIIKGNKFDSIHFKNDNVKKIILHGDAFDKDKEVSFNLMFANCPKLEKVILEKDLKNIKITNLAGMFYKCPELKEIIGLEHLNTEKVTDMGGMFRDCISLKNISFGNNFDTQNVEFMDEMFYNCPNLDTISGFEKINISNLRVTYNMFYNCRILKRLNYDKTTQNIIWLEYNNKI